MNSLITHIKKLALNEGINNTPLNGVKVFKASHSTGRIPLCYSQGIIIVVQGHKRVFFNKQSYDYNANNYLVLTLPLAAECETIVTPGEPLLSLIVDFDLAMLNELVRIFDDHGYVNQHNNIADNKGLFVSQGSEAFACVVSRLADCLTSTIECEVIGKGLVRELFFHVLQGQHAAPLFALVAHNTHLSKMERVLKHLHIHYENSIDVEQLASMANMSSSTFHRVFKQVTASSPIQYIKKIRLNRARELLLDQGLKVKQAAAQVGYESPTQFSREFSRYFGQTPSELHRS
ncbi:AraC family transcriptional regulator N-terminal domain-containing protein [Thalassotalea sp. PLHSN55]|uniref:AraC family transcriptional regulator n=1 Tax=Thalassotalea sp. PLHSN55 TaxID=3435888 RepID=UPI003F852248